MVVLVARSARRCSTAVISDAAVRSAPRPAWTSAGDETERGADRVVRDDRPDDRRTVAVVLRVVRGRERPVDARSRALERDVALHAVRRDPTRARRRRPPEPAVVRAVGGP